MRGAEEGLDWFFVSPAGGFGAFAPGERTGAYRVGGDVLLTDENGDSNLSGQDLAVALVDEIEKGDYAPSVYLALKIARALESTVEDLFPLKEDDHVG